MKKLFLICGLAVIAGVVAQTTKPSGKITLAWDYPANQLSTNVWFRIYHSTNITVPLTNWTVIAIVQGTNLTASVQVTPGVNFFAATASNFWGESDFSNVVPTPALPVANDVNLTVRRAD